MLIKKSNDLNKSSGFTLIEMLIVVGLTSVLFGFIVFNLFRFQNTSSQQSNIDSIISSIKSQQFKAMTGIVDNDVDTDDYGVYFLTDGYVLFKGSTYDQNNPDNFEIDLPPDLEFINTTIPGNTLVFSRRSGDMSGYVVGQDSFTVRAKNIGRNITVTLNRYGVITIVN